MNRLTLKFILENIDNEHNDITALEEIAAASEQQLQHIELMKGAETRLEE